MPFTSGGHNKRPPYLCVECVPSVYAHNCIIMYLLLPRSLHDLFTVGPAAGVNIVAKMLFGYSFERNSEGDALLRVVLKTHLKRRLCSFMPLSIGSEEWCFSAL